MPTRARVALVRASATTVLRDYERLLALVECRAHLDSSAPTILNAGVSRHFPFPSANTPPWQFEGVVRGLRAAGYGDLLWNQSRPTIAKPFADNDLNGYAPLAHAYGVPMRDNFNPGTIRWARYRPRSPMLVLDHVWKDEIAIPDHFIGKNIVQLPALHAERTLGLAGAMRAVAAGLHDRRRYVPHGRCHELLVDLLAIQREIQAGCLVVADGTTVGGPRALALQVKNVLMASADPVALDAVAAQLFGFDPLRDLAYVRLAHERGLGAGAPRLIELVGDTDLASEHWQIGLGTPGAWPHTALDRTSALGLLRLLLGGMPADRVLDGIERYDGYYRWPARDRGVFASWLRGTHWGRLFQQYCKRFQAA